MLESFCRNYCSNEWYQYFGQYFWPEKLITVDWLTEWAPEIKMAAIASGVLIAGAGGLYWMKNKNGKNEITPVKNLDPIAPANNNLKDPHFPIYVSAPNRIPATKAEEASAALNVKEKKQPKEDFKPKPIAAPVENIPKPVKREPAKKVVAMAPKELAQLVKKQDDEVKAAVNEKAAPIAYEAGQCFSKWLIVSEYIKLNNKVSLRIRAQNPAQKEKVIKEVLELLGLPVNGVYPTDPEGIAHFNHVMTSLKKPEYCMEMKNGLRCN